TVDVDLQHVWQLAEHHEIVWGAGYRFVRDIADETPYVQFTPSTRSDNLFSAFVQDKIAIVADSFFLTLGSTFEHNDYTGFEYQPSARLSWLPDDKQTVWAAISRAVRTPNIATEDSQLVVGILAPGLLGARVGVPNSDSEELIAYELGYRVQPTKNI